MTSPNVAEALGSSRSWNTITGGPGISSNASSCAPMLAYASPPRGGAMLRKVDVRAYPTIGGKVGKQALIAKLI